MLLICMSLDFVWEWATWECLLLLQGHDFGAFQIGQNLLFKLCHYKYILVQLLTLSLSLSFSLSQSFQSVHLWNNIYWALGFEFLLPLSLPSPLLGLRPPSLYCRQFLTLFFPNFQPHPFSHCGQLEACSIHCTHIYKFSTYIPNTILFLLALPTYYQEGKDIVLRFIIEYSSFREFL